MTLINDKLLFFRWYPRAESNRQLCFSRALLDPFNYGDISVSRLLYYHATKKIATVLGQLANREYSLHILQV